MSLGVGRTTIFSGVTSGLEQPPIEATTLYLAITVSVPVFLAVKEGIELVPVPAARPTAADDESNIQVNIVPGKGPLKAMGIVVAESQ